MMLQSSFELTPEQDNKGMWSAVCPFCEWMAIGFLQKSCVGKLIGHMNDQHPDGRIGNA
jgi:hypothetical protein